MAEYEPIFTQNGGPPPPPPGTALAPPPPPPKKKGKKKKKKVVVPGSADSVQPNLLCGKKKVGVGQDEGGDDEEFVQSAYSAMGAAGDDGAEAVKQTTTFGRICCYLLVANLIFCSVGAMACAVMFLMGVQLFD